MTFHDKDLDKALGLIDRLERQQPVVIPRQQYDAVKRKLKDANAQVDRKSVVITNLHAELSRAKDEIIRQRSNAVLAFIGGFALAGFISGLGWLI